MAALAATFDPGESVCVSHRIRLIQTRTKPLIDRQWPPA